jgi:hypothetical protein
MDFPLCAPLRLCVSAVIFNPLLRQSFSKKILRELRKDLTQNIRRFGNSYS